MRILTGYLSSIFYAHTPSEPILALAAFQLMHMNNNLPKVIETFSDDLCKNGLIEWGLLGELGARLLFIVARDLTLEQYS